ncbi:MAG: hypothetical protein NZ455_02705 [Bacteroidia bacterium]|nr:hypothetical protein [Bacteroidia bacterium]MDW8347286.1 hypothetical protein [Bacteroidia bacterium]
MQKKWLWLLGWLCFTTLQGQNPFVVGGGVNFIPVSNRDKVPSMVNVNMRYMLEGGLIATDQGLLTLRAQYLHTSYFLEQAYRFKNPGYEPYRAVARLDAFELAFGGRVFSFGEGNFGEVPYGGYLQFECSRIWYTGTYASNQPAIIAYNLPDLSQNTIPMGNTYRNRQRIFSSALWGFNVGIGYHFRLNDNFILDIGCSNGYTIRDITVNQTETTSQEVANTAAARRLFNIYFLSIHTGLKFKL